MPIKDQATPANRVTVVLRAGEGHGYALTLDSILPYLQLGAPVAIGRGTAVIASASDGDAIARLEALDDPASPIHSAVSLLEHVAEKIEQGEQPVRAQPYRQTADELRRIIGVPRLGLLGVDALSASQSASQSADAGERGADLLLAIERICRRVIQRESVCGGVIARAITEGRP